MGPGPQIGIRRGRGPGSSDRARACGVAHSDLLGARLTADDMLTIGETAHKREMMAAGGPAGIPSGQALFAGVADAV